MSDIITCEELKQLIGKGAVVVDVMTPEDFAACHLAGASNACVYEMVFLDRIAECAPGLETELIVYDETGTAGRPRLPGKGCFGPATARYPSSPAVFPPGAKPACRSRPEGRQYASRCRGTAATGSIRKTAGWNGSAAT
jgi:hypothetical protein